MSSKYRLVLLVFSTVCLLFLGLLYAFSMFAAPIAQDLLINDDISQTFNIMMLGFSVGAVIGGQIQGKIGIRASLIIAAVLFGAGFCITAAAGTGSAAVLFVAYGGAGGLGCGIAYNVIVATTNLWFPGKVGLSSGILMMGFSMAGLLTGNLALAIREAVGSFRPVIAGIGVIVFVLVVFLAFYMKRPAQNAAPSPSPSPAKRRCDV